MSDISGTSPGFRRMRQRSLRAIVANASASLAKSCSSQTHLKRPWRHIRLMMAALCITFQSRKSHVSMRIDGEWALFDDGVERPIIAGDIQASNEAWIKVPFLVDTGADRTVFSAATLVRLGLQPIIAQDCISGLGGLAASVLVTSQLRLSREDAGKV